MAMNVELHLGDCLDILPTIASESVDTVITDPPYPHIKRDYGTWTTEEWWALVVEGVIPEVRRILKPTGSAVFILQPNSEKVGKMRGWLWRFMYWVTENWNMVQDVWWWNMNALPCGVCSPRERGLLRASVKALVWAGSPECYRSQEKVLWDASESTKIRLTTGRAWKSFSQVYDRPSRQHVNNETMAKAVDERGGVTPFNLVPVSAQGRWNAGTDGHGAGTPLKLADWWIRYICPPGGTVCDPFMGSGTMGIAAIQNNCNFIGIEKMPGQGYYATAEQRIQQELDKARQLELC